MTHYITSCEHAASCGEQDNLVCLALLSYWKMAEIFSYLFLYSLLLSQNCYKCFNGFSLILLMQLIMQRSFKDSGPV